MNKAGSSTYHDFAELKKRGEKTYDHLDLGIEEAEFRTAPGSSLESGATGTYPGKLISSLIWTQSKVLDLEASANCTRDIG